jgi:hypothetical protein
MPEPHEHVLSDFLGILLVFEDPVGDRIDQIDVAIMELQERVLFASLDSGE